MNVIKLIHKDTISTVLLPQGTQGPRFSVSKGITVFLNCLSTVLNRGPGFSKHYTQLAQPYTQLAEHLTSFAK